MKLDEELALKGAICLLLVNDIPLMPQIAIESILVSTDQPVFLGFVNQEDVKHFQQNHRIHLIDLSANYEALGIENSDGLYSGWTNDDFFRIVQLKWQLLRKVLASGYSFVIYSDLDVVWIDDAYREIGKTFAKRPEVSIQIQSFTRNLDSPKLCMGFIGLRNDQRSLDFIETGAKKHSEELKSNPRIGDDDVATLMYSMWKFPSWIVELPQTTFPVGVSFNLFRAKMAFPGLKAQEPFIFHANFVVGLENKVMLMKSFLPREFRNKIKMKFTFLELTRIQMKLLKFYSVKFLRIGSRR